MKSSQLAPAASSHASRRRNFIASGGNTLAFFAGGSGVGRNLFFTTSGAEHCLEWRWSFSTKSAHSRTKRMRTADPFRTFRSPASYVRYKAGSRPDRDGQSISGSRHVDDLQPVGDRRSRRHRVLPTNRAASAPGNLYSRTGRNSAWRTSRYAPSGACKRSARKSMKAWSFGACCRTEGTIAKTWMSGTRQSGRTTSSCPAAK